MNTFLCCGKKKRLAGKEKWVYMCFIANLSLPVAFLS
jgi:hypothetical protein